MPYCTKCGKEIDTKDLYCASCKQETQSINEVRREQLDNTSGLGDIALIPEEIKGWNWAAFLFTWIWGIGNSVWISLLALVPYVGFIMHFILGAKGNEWAWRAKKWESVEHFKKTQGKWKKWALGFLLVYLGLFVLVFIRVLIQG